MNRAQRDTRPSAGMGTRVLRGFTKRNTTGTRAVSNRKQERPVDVRVTGPAPAGSRKVTGPASVKPSENRRRDTADEKKLRKTLEAYQDSLPQEKQDVDIDDLSRKIEDETEKSLNY